MYGRLINPDGDGNTTTSVVAYYYRNANGIIGRFMYAEGSRQVIAWDDDWQIRRVRTCEVCGAVNPINDTCSNCSSKRFKYKTAQKEILGEDLYQLKILTLRVTVMTLLTMHKLSFS